MSVFQAFSKHGNNTTVKLIMRDIKSLSKTDSPVISPHYLNVITTCFWERQGLEHRSVVATRKRS